MFHRWHQYTLWLIPLLGFCLLIGCGSTNDVTGISATDASLAPLDTMDEVFAAPKKDKGKPNNDTPGKDDTPAPSDEVHSAWIGPEGGTFDVGYNSSFFVPAGALHETVEITAVVSNVTVALDPLAIEQSSGQALSLLHQLYLYINALPSKNNGSGEWAQNGTKNNIRGQCDAVSAKVQETLVAYDADDGRKALKRNVEALKALDELDSRLASLRSNGQKKMGSIAIEKIQTEANRVRPLVAKFSDYYDSTLLFEFGPHGLKFASAAELSVPLSEVNISNEVVWYSGDGGESIEMTDAEYLVNGASNRVHYFIHHFSQYYFKRR